jgi:hypothetical protein
LDKYKQNHLATFHVTLTSCQASNTAADFTVMMAHIAEQRSTILWSYSEHVCYIVQVYSDLSVDYLKMFLLNVPATVVALGL